MSAPTPVEIRTGAREILSDPARWTVEASARDDEGWSVSPLDKSAVCWCAIGAVSKVSANNDPAFHQAVNALYDVTGRPIWHVNDEDGREAVLDVFNKAIERLS